MWQENQAHIADVAWYGVVLLGLRRWCESTDIDIKLRWWHRAQTSTWSTDDDVGLRRRPQSSDDDIGIRRRRKSLLVWEWDNGLSKRSKFEHNCTCALVTTWHCPPGLIGKLRSVLQRWWRELWTIVRNSYWSFRVLSVRLMSQTHLKHVKWSSANWKPWGLRLKWCWLVRSLPTLLQG